MPKNSASGMLSDLKSKLGFARDNNDKDDYDGDFGAYDDFDDDGYNDKDDRQYAGYGSDYNDKAPVGGFEPVSTRTSRYGRPDSAPNLVSIDDVKDYTHTRSTSREVIDDRAPAESSPAYNASARARERRDSTRTDGLDSLFESTSTSSSRDSYSSYSSYGQTRSLTVIKPVIYGDVERVASSLKMGNVVVLAMRNTPTDLMKRLLDFSFGVASALDASVECPGDRVYAIARGAGLSEDEKRQLRNQGVL
jgi:cell division inhibitor SepF